MLSRLNRFHGHGSVRRVYRLGKPVRSGFFSMHVLANDKVKSTKVSVVVSRKVHKSAVKRNRIRRRIYEQMRLRLPAIKTPTEIVITVYQAEVAEMSDAQLQSSLDDMIKRAKL